MNIPSNSTLSTILDSLNFDESKDIIPGHLTDKSAVSILLEERRKQRESRPLQGIVYYSSCLC